MCRLVRSINHCFASVCFQGDADAVFGCREEPTSRFNSFVYFFGATNSFFLRGEGTFLLSFLTGGWGHDYNRQGRSGAEEKDIQLPPLPWPCGPHVAGQYKYKVTYTHTKYCTSISLKSYRREVVAHRSQQSAEDRASLFSTYPSGKASLFSEYAKRHPGL